MRTDTEISLRAFDSLASIAIRTNVDPRIAKSTKHGNRIGLGTCQQT